MDGFIGPAANTRTFTEIPFGGNIGNNSLKDLFGAGLMKIGGSNNEIEQIVLGEGLIHPLFQVGEILGSIGRLFVENDLNIHIKLVVTVNIIVNDFRRLGSFGHLIRINKGIFDPPGNEKNNRIVGGLNILNGGGNAFTEDTFIRRSQNNNDIVFCRETNDDVKEE